ncbi:nuclear transport factor 2 family protein [Novosphingobium olei]|uniref:Nuclear transport factor 2 family protein n=1 Tax=Novosphingobium olei TaxID=2728851 RepID=A0A7Y0BLY2_9SPHN|nr:nuclear transport factor 2 family protein [Novosphingobium olei]NML92892.1 nuclear transport factor 2 family protein [Novosphingobium olei]BEU99383.1 nuclear transport factor 2 family protein [Novosphingobium olei]
MATEPTLAGQLVRNFGNPSAMAGLYAPDVEWSLPPSLPFPVPMKGIDAVSAFNRSVWGEVYYPDCSVEILDETGSATCSAVRFIYRARFRANDLPYENEYTLFARHGEQGITEVFESLDLTRLAQQAPG